MVDDSRLGLVMGRRPRTDAEAFLSAGLSATRHLVIYSLGAPPSAEQQQVLGHALDLAGREEFHLELVMLDTPRMLLAELQPGDELAFDADPRETRRIEAEIGLGSARRGFRRWFFGPSIEGMNP